MMLGKPLLERHSRAVITSVPSAMALIIRNHNRVLAEHLRAGGPNVVTMGAMVTGCRSTH